MTTFLRMLGFAVFLAIWATGMKYLIESDMQKDAKKRRS